MNSLKKTVQEKRLLYRVLEKQDPEAYAILYDLYVEKIFRFVLFKVSNHQEAEDLTSDIFLKVWNYLTKEEGGQQIQSISGLFYATARNSIIDYYRVRAKKQTIPLDETIDIESDENTQEQIDRKQDVTQLFQSIRSLKEEYQEIILLRFIDELSIKEIGDIVGKKQTAVRVTLHRAIKKLQQIHEKK